VISAEGGAIQASEGMSVFWGDVVEVGGDGAADIIFNDATILKVLSSSLVVLDGCVGERDKAAICGGDAKVGSFVRTKPYVQKHSGGSNLGISLTTLIAFTLGLIQEIKSASSDLPLLEDDIITYKDLEHGVFEIVTKEDVPRTIIVDDPGVAVYIRPEGPGTLSVTQVTIPASQISDLLGISREAFDSFLEGLRSPFVQQTRAEIEPQSSGAVGSGEALESGLPTYDLILPTLNIQNTNLPPPVQEQYAFVPPPEETVILPPPATIDTQNPTVAIGFAAGSLSDGSNSTLVTFTFSEAPEGFALSDVTAVGGALSNLQASGDPLVYTATFTAQDGFVGAGSVSIAAGQFTDAALNPGGAASDSIAIDTVSDPNDFDWLGSPGNDIVGNPDAHQPQTIYGGSGDDAIYGGTGGDTIFGGSGTDSLYGNNSGDVLYGGSGIDFLWGGNGSDRLIGGYGADTLTDGLGNDIFVYLFINDSRPGEADTITHFNSNIDTIDLSAIDANVNVAGIQHFTAVTQTTDVQVNNINWYLVGGETIIQADVNGDAIADFEIYLAENIVLQTTDFILS
jgi:hypothetical protein